MNPSRRIFLLILFHCFGIIACSIDIFKPLFEIGTPYHLILINVFLFYDAKIWNTAFALCLLFAFFLGMISEIIGINTGLLFGDYHYTDALGYSVFGVPLLIGLTWTGTAYACNSLIQQNYFPKLFRPVLASLLMVAFDIVLEQFATRIPLWQWAEGKIPMYNYFCWFVIGLVISYVFQLFSKISYNKVALYYIVTQLLFFLGYLFIHRF